MIEIKARRGWSAIDLAELWKYRELLLLLVWRDLKVRYKQTFFGAAWAVAQPLGMMLVFTIFLGQLARVPSDGLPYALFAYSALVPWTLFAQSVAGGAESLVLGSALITKVYFPRLLMPLAASLSFLVDFAIGLVILGLLMIYYRVGLTWNALWLVPITALAFTVASSVGILFAALNVRYRDVRYALPFVLQVWLFA